MLPEAGIFHFPWEISSGALGDGTAVRTFGRLVSYRAEDSLAVLSSQHASAQYEVLIHTAFVEPFHPQVGTQYVALGELESKEGKCERLPMFFQNSCNMAWGVWWCSGLGRVLLSGGSGVRVPLGVPCDGLGSRPGCVPSPSGLTPCVAG
uniref:TEN1 subunit of CST complex n=1 Tax=Scleropages formosus TaxID=113540 RepID=A0A8C9UYZ7_SCLFO